MITLLFSPRRAVPPPGDHPSRSRGFTLVELLVVIAVVTVLIALVAPVVGSLLGGTQLSAAGRMVSDTLALARQESVKANREVYILFYQLPADGKVNWRGMQVAYLDKTKNPPAVTPLGKVILLPNGIQFSEATFTQGANTSSYSPLLMQPTVSGTRNVNGLTNVPWQGFRFRADGSLDRAIKPADAYVTVVASRDSGASPKNYYTVQVNSITGMVRSFRP